MTPVDRWKAQMVVLGELRDERYRVDSDPFADTEETEAEKVAELLHLVACVADASTDESRDEALRHVGAAVQAWRESNWLRRHFGPPFVVPHDNESAFLALALEGP